MNDELLNIDAFGISLRCLQEADIQMLCKWRNNDNIRLYMEDSRHVSSEVMNFWIRKIHKNNSTYPYISYYSNKPIGYVEIKNINYNNKSCEGGLFLFRNKYIGTGISYNIALCREIVMHKLNLKTLISKIHKNNTRSINFCKKYGGEYSEKEGDFIVYTCNIVRRRERLKIIAQILGKSKEFAMYFEGDAS